MKIYIVPTVTYREKDVTFSRFLDMSLKINMIAKVVLAMNKEEAIGRIMLNLNDEYPKDDGWKHMIGDMDIADSTEVLKKLIEKL